MSKAIKNPLPIWTKEPPEGRENCVSRPECLNIWFKLPRNKQEGHHTSHGQYDWFMDCSQCEAYNPITRADELDQILERCI